MRVMPNTPCLIGQAASAYVLGTHATDDDAQKTYALMSSVGELMTLPCTVPANSLSAPLMQYFYHRNPQTSSLCGMTRSSLLDRSVSNCYKQGVAH